MGTTKSTENLFAAWWELYPRKVGKGAARAAYYRALRRVGAERLQEALAAQIAAGVFGVEPIYIPHAKTWLAQERWDDELTTRRAASVADGIAETWRDACRRADERGKARIRAEAERQGVSWDSVREALARMQGGGQ